MKPTVRRGLALPELIAALAMGAVLLLVLLPSLERARRLSMLGEDLSHYRTIAALTGAYAADFEDHVWSFSWQSGVMQNTPWPDLNTFSSSDMDAAAKQFTALVRGITGRNEIPLPTTFFPYAQNSHVVLAAYAGMPLPNRVFVSALDPRSAWADDPLGYDQGLYTPHLGVGGVNMRQPYSSGRWMGTAFYDRSAVGSRVYPSNTLLLFVPLPNVDLAPRLWAEVVHPSQKAFLHDRISRGFGPREAWNMAPEARLPVLMADGSALMRHFGQEANPGAHPNTGAATFLNYSPTAIEPPVGGPNPLNVSPGPMWTRGHIAGRDFGGPESPH